MRPYSAWLLAVLAASGCAIPEMEYADSNPKAAVGIAGRPQDGAKASIGTAGMGGRTSGGGGAALAAPASGGTSGTSAGVPATIGGASMAMSNGGARAAGGTAETNSSKNVGGVNAQGGSFAANWAGNPAQATKPTAAGAAGIGGTPLGGTAGTLAGGTSSIASVSGGKGGAGGTNTTKVTVGGANAVVAAGSGNGGAAGIAGGAGAGATGGVSGSNGIAGVAGSIAGSSAVCPGGKVPATGCSFVPANAPSCPTTSTLRCQGESCCTAIAMPGGTYPMGRGGSDTAADYYPNGNQAELPEHSATVAPMAIDKYEVTVGRFREFLGNYDSWRVSHPTSGAGAIADVQNTGWGQSWAVATADLPGSAVDLEALVSQEAVFQTWSHIVGTPEAETYPINGASWYVALAFCIWDGGRLPTEAEWEYAAAGGDMNRLYPWGSIAPYGRLADFAGSDNSPMVPVGSKVTTGGAGYFGHADFAGSVFEWVFDWYADGFYGTPGSPIACNNCANTTPANARVIRGGGWSYDAPSLRNATRSGFPPNHTDDLFGIRCARALE